MSFVDHLSLIFGRDWSKEASRIQAIVEQVKYLKRIGASDDAVYVLLKEIDVQENDARLNPGWSVAPWYYEQLAIVYRKQKRLADEIAILERYEQQAKAPGAASLKIQERLQRARKYQERP